MIWFFAVIVIFGSVIVITYPLFRSKIRKYEIAENSQLDYSQANLYMNSLSDLEDDYALGRLSDLDYNQQKIFLQRIQSYSRRVDSSQSNDR